MAGVVNVAVNKPIRGHVEAARKEVGLPEPPVGALNVPVGIWGDPKLIRNPLVGLPVIRVACGVPCFVLREWGRHLGKDPARLEVYMEPVHATHEGFCHLQVVLDRDADF